MSGTLKFHQLLLLTRLSSKASLSTVSRTAIPRNAAQRGKSISSRFGERRMLTAQAAPAFSDIPSQTNDAPSALRTGRGTSGPGSAANRAGTPHERGGIRQRAEGTQLDRDLARMDVDVKKMGRVPLQEFLARLEDVKSAETVSGQTALLMIRCCGNLLPELKATDRAKLTEELWNKIQSAGTRLDISHYNALLKVHLENNHQFDPTAFLSTLEQKAIVPNRVTYQRMIAYYCQKGDIEGATRILEFMRAKDLPINETVFNVLIQGYARANDMQSAEGVLEMMRSSQLEPSSATYRALLVAFAEKGDMASITRIIEDAEKRGITLSDSELFDVIQALAEQGHSANVGDMLQRLRKAPGFFHDALNASLRLVDAQADDVAYRLLSSLNVPKELEDRSGFGTLFIRKLIRYNHPIAKIWHYVEDMRSKQLNPWAVERACEAAFIAGRMDYAKDIIRRMFESGMQIRAHYFWPIFAAYKKEKDVKGVWDTLTVMSGMNVPATLETLTQFVLPVVQGLSSEEIVDQFKTRFPSVGIMNPLLVFHLNNGDIEEALRLLNSFDIPINASITVKPLAEGYLKNQGNFELTQKVLRQIIRKVAQFHDQYDCAGQFLVSIVQQTKGDEKILVDVLQKLAVGGFKMSPAVTQSIENRFRGRAPEKIQTLLDQLTSNDPGLRTTEDDAEFGKHPRDMNIEELEAHLKELKSKNMNTRGVLRRLLVETGRLRDVKRAEEIKAELETSGFQFTGAMYAQLMDMYTAQGDLEKALSVQKAAASIDRDFIVDNYKILNLAALMVSQGKVDDAIALLEDYIRKHGKPMEYEGLGLERNVFRVLNAAAEKGDVQSMNRLWDALNKIGKMAPTNMICGPLLKVHMVRNDLPAAIKAFDDVVEKFKQTPWKGELMRRLIEVEDTGSLQKVMDASIKLHGETNSLYDLAFAFVEAGRPKQAQKIFDTPGLRARHDRLENFSDRLIENDRLQELEGLVSATRDVFDIDRDLMYYQLIRLYGKLGDPDKALAVWTNMQEESVQASPRTLRALAHILNEHKRDVPFDVPEETRSRQQAASPSESKLLTLIREDNPDGALEQKRIMEAQDEPVTVEGYSNLIELLLQKDRVKEAFNLTQELLQRGNHPYPTVCKFLISKLSRAGDVALMEELAPLFTDKLASFLQLQKSIFNAYVNSNRSDEILARYEKDGQVIPVGGLINMMRTSPNLIPRVEKIVDTMAQSGDLRAAMALWSYYFSERKFEEAKKLLDKYPATTLRLRAYAICEKAKETNDVDLLRKLIDTLRDHSRPNVALAYSALIGLSCHNRDYRGALEILQEAEKDAGLQLNELRLSALRVLERGLIQMGQPVPFKVPEHSRSGPPPDPEEEDDVVARVKRQ